MSSENNKSSVVVNLLIPILTLIVGTILGTILDVRQYFDGRNDKLDDERKEISELLGQRLDAAKEKAPRLDCYLKFDSQTTAIERRVSEQLRNYAARSGQIRNDPLRASREELLDKRMDAGIISTWVDSADILQKDVQARLTPSKLKLARAQCDG